MKFHKDLAHAFSMLGYNWRALVLFELLYKLVITVLSMAIIKGGLQLLLHLTGLPVITQENIAVWLKNPAVVVALLLLALFAAFVSLLDGMAVIHCMNASHHRQKVTVQDLFAAALKDAVRALKPRNWLIVVFILVIAPFTQSHAASGMVLNLQLPGFIQDYINAQPSLYVLFSGVVLLLTLVSYILLFCLHTFLFDAKTYWQACKKSATLMRRHPIRCAVSSFLWLVVLLPVYALLNLIPDGIACLLIWKLADVQDQLYLSIIAVSTITDVIRYLWALFVVPLSLSFLCAIYYDCRAEAGFPETPELHRTAQPKLAHLVWRLAAIVTSILLLINVVVEAVYSNVKYDADGKLVVQPQIAAHRGSSIDRPENTMPAYEQAIADGADWIEMDVHQTKDGVIVVSHDASLKRIAGVNKNIYDLTYDELKQYDVGSWFSPEYSDLRIMTLDELIKNLDGRIPLNIELKPTGHEPNFEENVIQVVKDNDFEEHCVLASLNQQTVRRIEELNPEIDTLYLMAAEQGNLWNLDFADGFSIEESFVSDNLVSTLHNHGKTVWAWTLNTPDSISAMQNAGVDYLLTDDPVMARGVISQNRMEDGIAQVLLQIFPAPEVNEEEPANTAEAVASA